MSSKIRVRAATEEDLETMVEIGGAAFEGSPSTVALFPERLRIKPGRQDETEYRLRRWREIFPEPESHFIVAVEEKSDSAEEIVGIAMLSSPCTSERVEEVIEDKKSQWEASLPPCIDKDVLLKLRREGDEWVESVMGKDGTKDFWIMQAIAVHPTHRRKGAGRLLVQWGIDEATKDGKDVWLIATPEGRRLYSNMNFEVIAEKDELGELQTCMWRSRKGNRE